MTWQVTNNGTGPTDRDAWADAVYVSDDNEWSGDDQLVFALPHNGVLQKGQFYEQTAEFTLPPTARGSHVLVRTNVDPRIALTEEQKFLEEVRAVLERVEAATGKPIGEISVSDLSQFSRGDLLSILAGSSGSARQVYESVYTDNNVGATESVITDVPADLAVTAVVADAESRSGEPIDVNWTVENIGSYATSNETGSIFQYVFLSQDAEFDPDRALLVDAVPYVLSEPLQPGETYSDSTQVATPPGSSGIWYAHVFVNINLRRGKPSTVAWSKSGFPDWVEYFQSRAWEAGAKDNNAGSSDEVDVEYAEPNLVISDLSAVPIDPDSGGVLEVTFTVSNEGTRTTRVDQWYDRIYLSTDTSPDSFDILLGTQRQDSALAVGESYEVSTQVRMPDNIGGTFFVIAQTDTVFRPWIPGWNGRPLPYPTTEGPPRLYSTHDAVAEFFDEGDNVQTVELDVQLVPTPDLVIDSLTSQQEVLLGEDFTIQYVTSNDGGAVPDRQTPYFDRVYLSRDRFLDVSSDHFVTQILRADPLASGATETIDRTLRLPRGLIGDYYVIVVTDVPRSSRPDGEVIESDESNNIRVADAPMLIIAPPPSDLQVTQIFVPATGEVGDVLSVSWQVGEHRRRTGPRPNRRRGLLVGGRPMGSGGSVVGTF